MKNIQKNSPLLAPALPRLTKIHQNTGNGQFEETGTSENAGLLTYCLEYLNANEAGLALMLLRTIEAQAIEDEDGFAWWRWEKTPQRGDYFYPIDWDDQLKAHEAIKAAKERFGFNSKLKLPAPEALRKKIVDCFYQNRLVGEDEHVVVPADGAIYMFDITDGEKKGNKEDIFVTAVILDSGYNLGVFRDAELVRKVFERLHLSAVIALKNRYSFHEISRCYLSWSHYLFLLERINRNYQFGHCLNELWSEFSRFLNDWEPDVIERSNLKMELFFRNKLTEVNKPDQSINIFVPDERRVIAYRHRRLDSFFSSNYWDQILFRTIRC